MNSNMLRAEMVLYGDTGQTLSKVLGIAHNTFSNKLNGRADFTQSEIRLIKERYSLSPIVVDKIFFCSKCILIRDTKEARA